MSLSRRSTAAAGAGALLAGLLVATLGAPGAASADPPAAFGTPRIAAAPWRVSGLAYDAAGDLFAVDNGAKRVVEFRPDSSMTVPASGLDDPQGIAVDAAGDLFVADGDHLLELSAGGARTTVATGLSGIDQLAVDPAGQTVHATIPNSNRLVAIDVASGTVGDVPLTGTSHVTGVTQDSAGDVFVSDNSSAGAVIELPAGGGPQQPICSFPRSVALAVDGSGNLFGDADGGIVEQPAGGGAQQDATDPHSATAVAVDAAGDVAVAQDGDRSIVVVPADGSTQRVLVRGGVDYPEGIAVAPDGTIDIANYGDPAAGGPYGSVWRQPVGSTLATQVAGGFPAAGMALDVQGDLYVGDLNSGAVTKYLPDGGHSTVVQPDQLNGVASLATDRSGDLFLSGGPFGLEVDEVTPDGTVHDIDDTAPWGMATDSAGNVYLTNDNPRITVLAAGTFTQSTFTTTGGNLTGIAVAPDGTVYAGTDDGDLDMIGPDGSAQVIATGLGEVIYVALDSDGNVYVCNYDEIYEVPSLAAPVITGVSATGGPGHGGQTVTITGHRFTGASQVYFGGGRPATDVTVESSTRITATAPAHAAGTVNVRAVTPTGSTPVTAADHYTYRAPVVATVRTPAGPVAGGNRIALAGSDFTGATAVTVDGAPATNVVVLDDHHLTATVAAHAAGTVDVTVTGPDGTSNAARYAYQDPPVIGSASPAGGPAAGGDTVTIHGTGFSNTRAVYFSAGTAAGFHVDSDTQITATSPAHAAGTVNIRVVTPGGPSPLTAGDRYRYAP